MSAALDLPIELLGARLRRLRPDDLPRFQAYRADPDLGRYQGWTPMSDADAATFLARMHEKPLLAPGQWLQLGIAEAATDALIGDIGVYLADDDRRSEIGFTLAREAQGRGIATAAVGAALRLVFENTAVREVLGVTDVRNVASARLQQRLGFEYRESREALARDEPCIEQVYVLTRLTASTRLPAA